MSVRILLALDDSPASAKATEYVAECLGGAAFVRIAHVLPPVPPMLQSPAELAGVDGRKAVDERREAWLKKAKNEARPHLEQLEERLRARSEADIEVDCGFLCVPPEGTVVSGLIDVATDHYCETIVVGRNTLPWYRELFHRHVADELVKKAKGFTVWVVE